MMNAKSGRKPARQHSRGLSSSGRNSFGASNNPYLKDSVSYSRDVSAVGTRVFEFYPSAVGAEMQEMKTRIQQKGKFLLRRENRLY
jgi:hypothetical protein